MRSRVLPVSFVQKKLQLKNEVYMWLVYGIFVLIVLSLFLSMVAYPPRTRL